MRVASTNANAAQMWIFSTKYWKIQLLERIYWFRISKEFRKCKGKAKSPADPQLPYCILSDLKSLESNWFFLDLTKVITFKEFLVLNNISQACSKSILGVAKQQECWHFYDKGFIVPSNEARCYDPSCQQRKTFSLQMRIRTYLSMAKTTVVFIEQDKAMLCSW